MQYWRGLLSLWSKPLLMGVSLCNCACVSRGRIDFVSVHLVDYHDQQELLVPRVAGLEQLVGRRMADQLAGIIAPGETNERPDRQLLRVEFRSSSNLQAVASRDAVIFLHSYFCGRPNDFVVLSAPTVFAGGKSISAREPGAESSFKGMYYFFVNVRRKGSPDSQPPEIGFDLRNNPADICFYVTGSGSMGLRYKSPIAMIPKNEVAQAFR